VRLLITGGAGYIGSIAVERALAAGHEVTVLDNLWRGHRGAVADEADVRQADLRDAAAVIEVVADVRPDAILHYAAATIVPESVEDPLGYFEVNVVGSHNLIAAAIKVDVPRFVFSSTAAVYGSVDQEVLSEELPTEPINPYGRSKLMVEQMLEWHHRRYGLRCAIFRYFNVAGATDLRGEDHDPETHLIPVALLAATGKRTLTVFGTDYPTPDGTCIRDYVHVADLADAHLLAVNWLEPEPWGIFNLGTTSGSSVNEIVEAVRRATGRDFPVEYGPRRPGDPARLVADADRARRLLGWNPNRSNVDEMVSSAWRWMQAHPDGYGDI
jgi:UDP-glucose 4-epimerase